MRKKKSKRDRLRALLGKAVCIGWLDAACDQGWDERKEVVTLEICQTLGWLIAIDKEVVNVAQTQSGKKTTEVMAIPRNAITGFKRMR